MARMKWDEDAGTMFGIPPVVARAAGAEARDYPPSAPRTEPPAVPSAELPVADAASYRAPYTEPGDFGATFPVPTQRPGEVAVAPPGGGVIMIPSANVAPGATWDNARDGGVAVDYGLRPAPGERRPPSAPVWNRPAEGYFMPAPEGVAFSNQNGNVVSVRTGGGAPAAPRAPSVIDGLEAQARDVTATRRRIEGGMGTGGATSARDRAVSRAYEGERRREQGERSADAEAARRRAMPQGIAGPAGNAVWDGEKWVTRSNQVAASGAGGTVVIDADGRVTTGAPPAEAPPDFTERLAKIAPLARVAFGKDVDPTTMLMIAGMPPSEEKTALINRMGGKDPYLVQVVMDALGAAGVPGAGAAQPQPAARAAAATGPAPAPQRARAAAAGSAAAAQGKKRWEAK